MSPASKHADLKPRACAVDGEAMAEPICIQCGLPSMVTARLNRLPDGKVCPACRERVLAALPAALPASKPGSSARPRPVAKRKPTPRDGRA